MLKPEFPAMALTLLLSSKELNAEDIQELTIDLCNLIIDNTDIDAKLVKGQAQEGERGDPVTLGLIALTGISSGAAVALFNVLKSYVDRESSLTLSIEKDGIKKQLSVKNMQPKDVEKFRDLLVGAK